MKAFADAPPGLTLDLGQCMLTAAAKDVLKKDVRLLRINVMIRHCDSNAGLLADVLDRKSSVKG
jgi:hypothetical protein